MDKENFLAQRVWDILGRGILVTNEYDEPIKVEVDISDWREACEILLKLKQRRESNAKIA